MSQPSIAEVIADRGDQMTAGERRAAQTLIANYPMLGLRTVAEFSQQAGVSSPTILRFVSRIGFQNYAEFQDRLQEELAARLQSPLSRSARAASPPDDENPDDPVLKPSARPPGTDDPSFTNATGAPGGPGPDRPRG